MACRPDVAQAEHRVRTKLSLNGKVEVFRVGQTVCMPEGYFRVSVQRLERREIKRSIRLCLCRVARKYEGKDLPVRTVHAVIERRFKKLLSAGRPEEAERNVAHFLELAQILKRIIKNSGAGTNAGFSGAASQFCKKPFRRSRRISQAHARGNRVVLGWGQRLWNSWVAREQQTLRSLCKDDGLPAWNDCADLVLRVIPGLAEFPAQAKIESQTGVYAPAVLTKKTEILAARI